MRKNISDIAPFGLRIPDELKLRLDVAAGKNIRSLNSEMLVRLEDSFKRPLHAYSDGDLIAELMSRYERGAISIRIAAKEDDKKK